MLPWYQHMCLLKYHPEWCYLHTFMPWALMRPHHRCWLLHLSLSTVGMVFLCLARRTWHLFFPKTNLWFHIKYLLLICVWFDINNCGLCINWITNLAVCTTGWYASPGSTSTPVNIINNDTSLHLCFVETLAFTVAPRGLAFHRFSLSNWGIILWNDYISFNCCIAATLTRLSCSITFHQNIF